MQYNAPNGPPPQQYGAPSGPPPQQNGQYAQPPPNYGQNYGQAEQGYGGGDKPSFDQTFKIEKPKWNDLWAGILFIAVFAGYVAVSGLSISSYAATKSFNGGGIYDSRNTFSLDTNTLVLFIFCLACGLILSFLYVWAAR